MTRLVPPHPTTEKENPMTDLTDPTIAYTDVETTALHRRRRAWETAAIVRPPGQPDTEHHWFVDVRDLDLSYADPVSLRIGGFWDRHPQARWVEESGGKVRLTPEAPYQLSDEGVVREQVMLAAVAALTAGKAVIAGSNPAFDQYTLSPRMEWHGITLDWHYHPEDVPGVARGWLRAQGLPAPRKSDEVARACGINPDDYDRHTALGDCRLFRDLHDLVDRPPAGVLRGRMGVPVTGPLPEQVAR